MLNEENEIIIKSLIKYNIQYPLTVRGYDNRDFIVHNIYIHNNRVMMDVSVRRIKSSEKLRDYSDLFQKNLINQLKLFKDNIWDD